MQAHNTNENDNELRFAEPAGKYYLRQGWASEDSQTLCRASKCHRRSSVSFAHFLIEKFQESHLDPVVRVPEKVASA
jgi:hypothetical protein